MPGPRELLLILVLVLIFFGAGKLPKVMSELGKGLSAFKDGLNKKDSEKDTSETVKEIKKDK
ncbi:MAG: twin-arginine translocase TatA/TatE family subunit [Proteobacteria bacterium]|nr:twin-arginine translocase TatA/TatE family subunit [Pseudomonadota bacterium]